MWVKLDDSLGDDPRLATVGPTGVGALILGLCYANRNLSDGWVPVAVIRRALVEASSPEAADEATSRLLRVQVFMPVEHDGVPGYQIHQDYQQHQPRRADVLKQRRQRSLQKVEAGRVGGLRSGEARRKHTASTTEARPKQTVSTDEAPVPDPGTPEEKSTAAGAAGSLPPERRHGDAPRRTLNDPTVLQLRRLAHDVWDRQNFSSEVDSTTLESDFLEAVKRHAAQLEGFDYAQEPHLLRFAVTATLTQRVRAVRDASGVAPARPRRGDGFVQVAVGGGFR